MLNNSILLQITDPINVPIVLVIGVSVVILLTLMILAWFRAVELAELKEMEHKITAAEHGLEYAIGSRVLLDKLKNLELISQKFSSRTTHLFEYSSDKAKVQLFDVSYIEEVADNQYMNIDFACFWIQFNYIQLPSFKIFDDTKKSNQQSPFDSDSKISRTDLTAWMSSNLDVLKPPTSTTPSAEIEEILSRCRDISYLLDSDEFERLSVTSNHLCYYIREKLLVDSNQLARLKVIADHLVDVFDAAAKPASDLDEIDRLKRDEQG